MSIKEVRILAQERILKGPYTLSFVTLKSYRTIIVILVTERGVQFVSEAVALPGYGHESAEDVMLILKGISTKLSGLKFSEAREMVNDEIDTRSFARSPLLTAIDLADGVMGKPEAVRAHLVAPVAAQDPKKMVSDVRDLVSKGYTTVKMKIGRNEKQDRDCVEALVSEIPDRIELRLDANQGYNLKSAKRLIRYIEKLGAANIPYIEQPLPAENWEDLGELSVDAKVPLMLDESIYEMKDIQRADEIGVRYVKLKLVKHGGIREVVALAHAAKERGILVVFGNGVATDISNLVEALIYHKYSNLFYGALECNGFAKLLRPCLKNSIQLEKGMLLWRPATDGSTAWELQK
jgi:o-succinylbenzoate synthase